MPILANITEFGATPLFTVDELRSAGVAIALYPLSAFRAMNKAALDVYQALRRDGTQKAVVDTHADARRALRLISATTPTSRSSTRCSPPGSDGAHALPRPKENRMTDAPAAPKPKKSVALSGVAAGNTALCTVGRSGNDLAYRGYDILDIADACEFEEIALPAGPRQAADARRARRRTRRKLQVAARPAGRRCEAALEQLPAAAHPMDVMRTGVSALGAVLPEKDDHGAPGARDIADRLMASLGSMLLYWYHWSHNGSASTSRPTTIRSAGISCTCCTAASRRARRGCRAMHTSLNLYAEHEFNASTFAARVIAGTGSDIYSAITGAIGALRGPKHGGANEVAFEMQKRYDDARRGGGRHPRARRRRRR